VNRLNPMKYPKLKRAKIKNSETVEKASTAATA
jgi:hypothetical protein